jgi:hypothetical protein
MNNVSCSSAVLTAILMSACGGEPSADGAETETPAAVTAVAAATVTIGSPNEGEVIMTDAVTVRLSVEGMQIVPAGDTTSGTGHHHLYLDADLTAPGDPVPTVPGSIIHMGDGSAEYTFEGVAPGEHRLIAVVADGVHIPLNPSVVDTVMFTVNN